MPLDVHIRNVYLFYLPKYVLVACTSTYHEYKVSPAIFVSYIGAMERRKVTCPLTYFASGVQDRHKPADPLDSAPNKKLLPQGRFNIANNPQATISGNTNRPVKQEGMESYVDKAAEGATAIF